MDNTRTNNIESDKKTCAVDTDTASSLDCKTCTISLLASGNSFTITF